MIYRALGNTGLQVSAIGMGCEYVWHAGEKETCQVVQAAVDAGINYFDLFVATPSTRKYYGQVLSRCRENVYLAGHLGCGEIDGQYMKTRHMDLCRRFLDEFYKNLKTDYIDVLFLHNCDEISDFRNIMENGMYDYAKELQENKRAGLIGLSTHNTQIAIEAVKTGKIEVLMFPVNPLFNLLPQDIGDYKMKGRKVREMTEEEKQNYPTKQELYDLCQEKGVPIIAMKPFAAGNILRNHEEGRLKGLLDLTPVQCISYILSIPQVACPVPGFRNVDELNQSLAYLTATDEEKDFSEIESSIVAKFQNQCMYCNHCQPCPVGMDIAEVTKLADMAEKENTQEIKDRYHALVTKAGECLHCGACTERCPFGIDASENIARAERIFGC